MTNLLTHFEPSELVDFMNFIGLLIHRLQARNLPSLLTPISDYVYSKTCSPFSMSLLGR